LDTAASLLHKSIHMYSQIN